jgi:hypothetical protein
MNKVILNQFESVSRPSKSALNFLAVWLLLAATSPAAILKNETVGAWDAYVNKVEVDLQNRTQAGGTFLWVDEDPARAAKVQNGEILVAPAAGPSPRKVPGGLIHHWIGAAFFQNEKLDNILEVTEDYDHYKDFYRPSVIESKTLGRTGSSEKFSMLLMNKAFFLKSALDADYHVSGVRLSDRRFYSVSRSTRVQEVDDYDGADEHRLPEGQGGGYIWKLFSVIRLEERDGGVYVEVEAMALSREIPGALRFFVDPIVRRVSRNSVLTSIQQTEEAAHTRYLAETKRHVSNVAERPVNYSAAAGGAH